MRQIVRGPIKKCTEADELVCYVTAVLCFWLTDVTNTFSVLLLSKSSLHL